MPNPLKYYKTMGELIDHYVPNENNEPMAMEEFFENLENEREMLEHKLIHAYELGFQHATEEEQPDPAEFDTDWETQNES